MILSHIILTAKSTPQNSSSYQNQLYSYLGLHRGKVSKFGRFFTDRPLPLPLTHACKSPLLQLPADCFNNQQHQRTLLKGIYTMHHGMILSPSLLPTLSSHTISQDHIIEATPGCCHLTSTTTAGSLRRR